MCAPIKHKYLIMNAIWGAFFVSRSLHWIFQFLYSGMKREHLPGASSASTVAPRLKREKIRKKKTVGDVTRLSCLVTRCWRDISRASEVDRISRWLTHFSSKPVNESTIVNDWTGSDRVVPHWIPDCLLWSSFFLVLSIRSMAIGHFLLPSRPAESICRFHFGLDCSSFNCIWGPCCCCCCCCCFIIISCFFSSRSGFRVQFLFWFSIDIDFCCFFHSKFQLFPAGLAWLNFVWVFSCGFVIENWPYEL